MHIFVVVEIIEDDLGRLHLEVDLVLLNFDISLESRPILFRRQPSSIESRPLFYPHQIFRVSIRPLGLTRTVVGPSGLIFLELLRFFVFGRCVFLLLLFLFLLT